MAKKVFVPPGQAIDWFELVPSDTVNIADESTENIRGYESVSGIYIGDSGPVVVQLVNFDNVVIPLAVTGPNTIPFGKVKRVNATSTTATVIWGLISAQ